MAGMDDLDFEGLVDGALGVSDDDDTAKFDAKKLLRARKQRKSLQTPILSGRKMASESSHHLPLMDADTVEEEVDTSLLEPGSGAFRKLYERAGVTSEKGFDVFKLDSLYDDEEIAGLDPDARRAAVRAILKSHGVELQSIMDDAVARRDALEQHDRKMRDGVAKVEETMREQNHELEAEIEEFARPRRARIQANDERAERARRRYRDFFQKKQEELHRITEIVDEWGGDDRLRVTEKVAAVEEPTTVPTNAVQAASDPRRDVSGEEVFEIPPESDVDEWSFGEETSEPVQDAASGSSVENDLPVERHSSARPEATATDSFEFSMRSRAWFLPRTPLQGLVAAVATVLWVCAGVLLTAQLTMLKAPAALGVGFAAPPVLAALLAIGSRNSRRAVPFFGALLVAVLLALVGAHYDPQNLVRSLTNRPLWFVDEAGMNEHVEEPVHRLVAPYAELLAAQFGLETAAPDEEQTVE